MMQTSDILLKLVPFTHKENDIVSFTYDLDFGEWIVTSIVGALLIISAVAAIKLWRSYKKDLNSIQVLTAEIEKLKEKGFEYYNTFRENIKQDHKIAHLWNEFDESLIQNKETGKLENSLDADYFFNDSTLASHVGSKFYSALPGMLLGIGLLGTFFALYVALIELNLEGEELKNSIKVFIGMVGVKFTASVWGILLSVSFTFFEKLLEGILSKKISSLQDSIDDIFKRQTAEQNLFKIANESEQQTRAMNSLAETLTQKISEQFNPIVTQMNQHLEHMPTHISKAIGETLSGPLSALKENANNAAQSQSESLESIVNTFIEKLDQTAGDQVQGVQQLMVNTTEQLTQLLANIQEITISQNTMQKEREEKMQELFHCTMSSFEEQMDKIQTVFTGVSQDAASSMQDMYGKQQSAIEQERVSMTEQMNTMTNTLNELSQQSNERFKHMFNEQQKVIQSEKEAVMEQTGAVSSKMETLLASVVEEHSSRDEQMQSLMKMISDKHVELFDKNNHFASQMESLVASIMENMTQKVSEVQGMINETSHKLSSVPAMLDTFADSADNLKEFSSHTKESTNALTGSVLTLNKIQESISNEMKYLETFTESMKLSSSSTADVLKSAESTSKALQSTYREIIKDNAEDMDKLGEAMSKWLGEYDTQVHATMQNSLNEVQGTLSNFANTLSASIGSLEDAIESINTKVQG